jgi:hypothetical protein
MSQKNRNEYQRKYYHDHRKEYYKNYYLNHSKGTPRRTDPKVCKICGFVGEKVLFRHRTKVCLSCWPSYRSKQRGKYKKQIKNYNKQYSSSHRDYYKNIDLKRRYGITLDGWNILYNNQLGCCAVCGEYIDKTTTRICVDHDHATGKIRGLLCKNCNLMLGYAKDNILILDQAKEYLIKNNVSNLSEEELRYRGE